MTSGNDPRFRLSNPHLEHMGARRKLGREGRDPALFTVDDHPRRNRTRLHDQLAVGGKGCAFALKEPRNRGPFAGRQ